MLLPFPGQDEDVSGSYIFIMILIILGLHSMGKKLQRSHVLLTGPGPVDSGTRIR